MFNLKECNVTIHCFIVPQTVIESDDLFEKINTLNADFTGSLYEANSVEDDDE